MSAKHQSFCLQPARFRLDGGSMYGIIPKPLWEKGSPADDQNRIDLALRLWVIKTNDRLIVVDTGIGDHRDQVFEQRFDLRGDKDPLEKSLQSIGFSCLDVTDLVLSHLHFDHIGGIGKKDSSGEWVPTFPKARCHVHRQHYEYSLQPTARDTGSFHTGDYLPILEIYEKNHQMVWHSAEAGVLIDLGDDTLKYRCSHGHTPWLMHPYNSQFIYLADLVPTSHHIPIAWVMGYDISPGITTEDKKQMLQFVHQNNLKIIFEHDVDFWGAEIEPDPKKLFKLKHKFPADNTLAYKLLG